MSLGEFYQTCAFPKVTQTRREHKLEKQAEERTADTKERKIAWNRCKGRCESCGKRVKRGGGLIDGAQFDHVIPKSKGGRKTPIFQVLCQKCHFSGPSGAHRSHR